jgi:hypothetical protein
MRRSERHSQYPKVAASAATSSQMIAFMQKV